MIRLPDEMLVRHFESSLTRGAIIRFKPEDLDDPNRPEAYKFAVILSVDCSTAEIHYVFTTSKTKHYDENPQTAGDIIRVKPGEYGYFPLETIINFREVRTVARDKLKERILAGQLTFEGSLTAAHQTRADAIVRASRLIPLKVKRAILPGAVQR